MNDDKRVIPADLKAYLFSPYRKTPSLSMTVNGKLVLTSELFNDKWSFVYFTHSGCLPECKTRLVAMNNLRESFANADFQFLAIDIDNDAAEDLAVFLEKRRVKLNVLTVKQDALDLLARAFHFIFLRTDYTNGRYLMEQQHTIFLLDPKGRIYAHFKRTLSGNKILTEFLKIRQFYAKTE